jgi:MFS family permease
MWGRHRRNPTTSYLAIRKSGIRSDQHTTLIETAQSLSQLKEIVVTAEKRAQNLEKAPATCLRRHRQPTRYPWGSGHQRGDGGLSLGQVRSDQRHDAPFVLTQGGIGSPREVSLVLGANFVLAAVSYARLKGRWGNAPVFMSGLTCGVVGIALMGIVSGLAAQCLAAALAGYGTGIYNTYVFDHGVEISPPVYHGRAAGLLFAFMFFGAAINPLVAGVFEQGLGLLRSFPAMAVVALACGARESLIRSQPVPGTWRKRRQSTIRCSCTPSRELPRRMMSPARRNCGGFCMKPTPGGVPVAMRSPASNVMKRLM